MRFAESERRIVQEVTQLHKKEEFSNWLWHTLQLHYMPQVRNEKERKDFGDFWNAHDSPGSAIGNIYHDLQTEEQKLSFRQAIGDALIKHANDEKAPPNALRDLIYLIPRMKAVESLRALIPAIGNGPLGKKHPEYLYDTMAAVGALSPSPETQVTINQLVDSPNFDDGYIFEAIGILAKCEPSNILNLLVRFKPRINSLRQKVKALDEKERTAFYLVAERLIVTIQRVSPTINPDELRKIIFG